MSDYLLIGHPIAHSLSPLIHNKLFAYKGLSFQYKLADFGGNFTETLAFLKKAAYSSHGHGLKGFNVTIPFKEKIMGHLNELTDRARVAGAVNTVKISDKGWIGDNTDGVGFVAGLKSRGLYLEHKSVVILGAGGAARGIAHALCENKVSKIYICARRSEQAAKLIGDIRRYVDPSIEWESRTLDGDLYSGDLIVNTLPQDVGRAVYERALKNFSGEYAADIVYTPKHTVFLQLAKNYGLQTYFGLDMLFFQAVIAQEFWLGVASHGIESLLQEVYDESKL